MTVGDPDCLFDDATTLRVRVESVGSDRSPDLLFDGEEFTEFPARRIETGHDHGAGDTLAAAITGALAHGLLVVFHALELSQLQAGDFKAKAVGAQIDGGDEFVTHGRILPCGLRHKAVTCLSYAAA